MIVVDSGYKTPAIAKTLINDNIEPLFPYKSNPKDCEKYQYLNLCIKSKNNQKVIIRHVWEDYIEQTEDIRHTLGNKEIYAMRKETIERIFGTVKENQTIFLTFL